MATAPSSPSRLAVLLLEQAAMLRSDAYQLTTGGGRVTLRVAARILVVRLPPSDMSAWIAPAMAGEWERAAELLAALAAHRTSAFGLVGALLAADEVRIRAAGPCRVEEGNMHSTALHDDLP